jgi:hypothetical protein
VGQGRIKVGMCVCKCRWVFILSVRVCLWQGSMYLGVGREVLVC